MAASVVPLQSSTPGSEGAGRDRIFHALLDPERRWTRRVSVQEPGSTEDEQENLFRTLRGGQEKALGPRAQTQHRGGGKSV